MDAVSRFVHAPGPGPNAASGSTHVPGLGPDGTRAGRRARAHPHGADLTAYAGAGTARRHVSAPSHQRERHSLRGHTRATGATNGRATIMGYR